MRRGQTNRTCPWNFARQFLAMSSPRSCNVVVAADHQSVGANLRQLIGVVKVAEGGTASGVSSEVGPKKEGADRITVRILAGERAGREEALHASLPDRA